MGCAVQRGASWGSSWSCICVSLLTGQGWGGGRAGWRWVDMVPLSSEGQETFPSGDTLARDFLEKY